MKHAGAAEKRAVVDTNVTAKQTIVGDDDVVADLAIVPDVRAGHKEVFISNFRRASVRAPAMNRAMLANHVLIADFDKCFSVGRKRNVLRRGADDRRMLNHVVGTQCDVRFNDNM